MQSSQKESWQAPAKKRGQLKFAREMRRTLIVGALLGLTVLLAWYLFPPFFAPKTMLVLIGSEQHDSFNAPPIAFVAEDLDALATVSSTRSVDQSEAWNTARSAKQLSRRISQLGASPSDRLIVYLTAHGVSEDGEGYLLCDNFDLRRPDSGRISVGEFVAEISAIPAKTKLVLLNAGSLDYDPRLGMLSNDFPRLLHQAVLASGDSSLFVLCSHASLQTSHVSPGARRSVFGMFVGAGLEGWADLDADSRVSLSELVAFTSANVARWVTHNSDRTASQTPQLFWGGGNDIQKDPELVVLADEDREALTAAKLVNADRSLGSLGSAVAQSGKAQGVIKRRQITLASNSIPAKNQAADRGEPAAETTDTAPEGEPDRAAEAGSDTGEENAAADSSEASGGSPRGDESPDTMRARQLLANAWKQRDQSALSWSTVLPRSNLIENRPHLWRELQAELLDFEQRLRGGMAVDVASIESILEDSFPVTGGAGKKEQKPSGDGPKKPSAIEGLFSDIETPVARKKKAIIVEHAHSLALAEIVAAAGGRELDVDVDGLLSALAKGSDKELQEWMKANWQDDLAGYYELDFIKRLSEDELIGWELVQKASRVCLLGERVAALDLQVTGWVRDEVAEADQLRFFAEQLVFDRVGLDWPSRCGDLFTQAESLYRGAENRFLEVRRSQRLMDTLISRGPSYLKWHQMSGPASGDRQSRYRQIKELLSRLSELASLLDSPGQGDIDSLVAVRQELVDLQASVESACGNVSADQLLRDAASPGDAYRGNRLLDTPLLDSPRRIALMETLAGMDQQLASEGDLAKLNRQSAKDVLLRTPQSSLTDSESEFLVRQAELEAAYVRLSAIAMDEDAAESPDAARAVFDALAALQQAHESVVRVGETNPAAIGSFWIANQAFGSALQSFYRAASLQPESVSPCQGWTAVRGAERMLQMTDARDVWRLAGIDTSAITEASRVQSTLIWQAERLQQASSYRSGDSNSNLAGIAEAYRMESRLICARIHQDPGSLQMTVAGPENVDLRYTQEDVAVIGIQNEGELPRTVRLSLDFEPDLLEVTIAGQGQPSPSDRTPFRLSGYTRKHSPLETTTTGAMTLDPGQRLEIPLKIRRRDAASEATKLVLDLYETTLDRPHSDDVASLLGRKRMDVQLPVAEIYASSGGRSFLSSESGLKLLPHPNRVEPFRFGVVNRSSRSKKISMAFFPLDQTLSRLGGKPERWNETLAYAKPLTTFEIIAPGNGQPAFPAPPKVDKPEGAPAADGADKPAQGAGETSKDADKEEEKKPIVSTELPDGMLIRLTDQETGEITFRQVEFSIQRPRRYVKPVVGYDATKKQIRIEVAARSPALLPPGEPVSVTCSLVGDREGSTKGKLQGLLTRASPQANLFIKLDTPPPFSAQVHLEVDGYPRSFVFDVPCGKHMAEVPEVTDLLDLRMATASDNGVVSAAETIPVALQVDAPVGTFEDGRDLLEIGVDLEQTGLPDSENSVLLNSDRQVRLGYVKSAPGGTVELHTTVTDHVVDLPVDRLENLKLGVAGLLTVNGETLSFPSIPLMIDTAAPVVGPVNRTDGMPFVKSGGEIPLSAWAWDEGAGVKSVEAAFDTDGSGEFPEGGATFKGIRKSKREWVLVAQAGADVGPQTLLVRGVDLVGNASDPIAIPVEIVSVEMGEELTKKQTVTIAGTVTVREKQAPEAEVKLIASPEEGAPADAEPKAVEVRTAENGRYQIPDVPPGSYTLSVRAVVRNKPYLADQPVVVTPGPKRTVNVDVKLP